MLDHPPTRAAILRQALHPFVGPVARLRIAGERYRRLRAQRRHPKSLLNFERRVTSEHGEDGIIAEIFRRIGTACTFFVECAVGDGTQNNTRALLAHGWRGLWIEGSADRARRATRLVEPHGLTPALRPRAQGRAVAPAGASPAGEGRNPSGACPASLRFTAAPPSPFLPGLTPGASGRRRVKAWPVSVRAVIVTAENFTGILHEAGVPRDFDLLSLDIDGNDFWVWKAFTGFSPRVVAIEYNASVPPGQPWVMPYDPQYAWRGSRRFGASLAALAALGREKGYALVGCDSSGVNAFFVRRDLCGAHFPAPEGGAAYHYVPPNVWGRYFWLAASAAERSSRDP